MANVKSIKAGRPIVQQTDAEQTAEACRLAFGAYPDDVLLPLRSATETFGWLEAIMQAIARAAEDGRPGYSIKALADAGAYLAMDFANVTDCEHGRFRDALIAAGALKVVDGKKCEVTA